MLNIEIEEIGTIHTAFTEKFGIPRQGQVVPQTRGVITFYPPYNQPAYFSGLEEFSHLWILWHFSEHKGREVKATVRPPRLGGNKRVGVFASRSPYRPNSLGMTAVKLQAIHTDENGKVSLEVSGVDMLDGTPIFDIKPYIHTDIYQDASSAYADKVEWPKLDVQIQPELLNIIPNHLRDQLIGVLAEDPRPKVQEPSDKTYGMHFDTYDILFEVKDDILEVTKIIKTDDDDDE